MRAVTMTGYGSTDVLEIAEIPDPLPSAGEVLVDVRAASVNGADQKLRTGATRYADIVFPHIPGRDFAGVISGVGAGADLKVGDEVFGVCVRGTDGGQAEKIAIAASIVAPKPATLDFAESAALALTGITALYALEDVARVQPGQRVLIQGGAGGVGSVAVQLAHHLGAVVTTTASSQNHDYVRSLGADEVIDYRQTDFTALGHEFDVVYDTVGGEVQARSATVVRPGGILVVCAPGTEDTTPSRSDISVVRPVVGRDRAHLNRISELVAAGALRAPAITRFPLEGVREAHLISQARHLQGKLVLEMA
jgi:NADPH:quinone reductase-like Zn-dependent oxidoreductase